MPAAARAFGRRTAWGVIRKSFFLFRVGINLYLIKESTYLHKKSVTLCCIRVIRNVDNLNREKTMNMLKKCAAVLLLFGVVFVLAAGCNTIEGAGKDIERSGEAIQDAAD